MRSSKEKNAKGNYHWCATYPTPAESRWAAYLSSHDYANVCGDGFVALAACFGFPKDLSRMVQETGQEVSLLLGSRAPTAWGGPLPCSCMDAEGHDPTEARQAWLVASWYDQDREGQECCWVYGQVRIEEGNESSVPERIEDARAWWVEQYWSDRNAVVVQSAVGASMVFKHNRCSPSDRRWFRLRRYRGVEAFPLRGVLRRREYIPPNQAERNDWRSRTCVND